MKMRHPLRCDCTCNGGDTPCSGECGHRGCRWKMELVESAEKEARRIDAGLTRSHKPAEKRESPSDATRSSGHSQHVKLQSDTVIGNQTITRQEWLRLQETNQGDKS